MLDFEVSKPCSILSSLSLSSLWIEMWTLGFCSQHLVPAALLPPPHHHGL